MLSLSKLFANAKSFGYNHAVNAEMPVVYVDGNELKREQYLKYLGITFDRSLCGNEHVTRTSWRESKVLRAFCNRFELANSFLFQATVRSVMENQEQDFDE